MSEKTYNDNGYVIKNNRFIIVYNQPLTDGYDWFISKNPVERCDAIGIKRNDKGKSITTVNSLNYIREKYKLY